MLILLSPAKTQNFNPITRPFKHTLPQAQNEIKTLIGILKVYKSTEIEKLMSLSSKLAELNYERFQIFDPTHFTLKNAKPTIHVFEGEAYRYLAANTLSDQQIEYMQDRLLILSGLYGYLRPLDLIQPYRLEMGTKLPNAHGKNLYAFWGDKITQAINQHVKTYNHKIIINLASDEYFKAVQTAQLIAPIMNIHFKEKRKNRYQTIGINAKRARGLMTRFMIENKIDDLDGLKKFTANSYYFNLELSDENSMCFIKQD